MESSIKPQGKRMGNPIRCGGWASRAKRVQTKAHCWLSKIPKGIPKSFKMIKKMVKNGYLGSLVLKESCNSSSHSVLHPSHRSPDTPAKDSPQEHSQKVFRGNFSHNSSTIVPYNETYMVTYIMHNTHGGRRSSQYWCIEKTEKRTKYEEV